MFSFSNGYATKNPKLVMSTGNAVRHLTHLMTINGPTIQIKDTCKREPYRAREYSYTFQSLCVARGSSSKESNSGHISATDTSVSLLL